MRCQSDSLMHSWCLAISCGGQLDTLSKREDMLKACPQWADAVCDLNIGDSIYALALPSDPNSAGWRWVSFREAYSTTCLREGWTHPAIISSI